MRGNPAPRRGGHLLLPSLLAAALLIIPACGHDETIVETIVEERIVVVDVLHAGSPLTGSVAKGDFRFYAAAVIPGAFYKISITGLNDDADLLVFGDDGTFTVLSQCSIDNTAYIGTTTPEGCVIRAPGGTLYFGVDGYYLAGSVGFFTIAVDPVATTSLTLSMPLLDALARWEARIYAVHAPVPDDYTISITGLSDDADLHVFGADPFLTAPATCLNTQIGTLPENCTFPSGGGVLYFVVDGLFSSTATVSYTALAAPAMP